MPSLFIDKCSQLKAILELIDFLPPHKWLISDLTCYDNCNWDGCDKWAEEVLILTDEELKKDVYLRDMQFFWGVFSAIPEECDNNDFLCYELPFCESDNYNKLPILPQHPLAMLEINFFDASYTYITAHNADFLKPFYNLPYDVRDEEENRRIVKEQTKRIQDMINTLLPDLSGEMAEDVKWSCWLSLFRKNTSKVSDKKIAKEISKAYGRVLAHKNEFPKLY